MLIKKKLIRFLPFKTVVASNRRTGMQVRKFTRSRVGNFFYITFLLLFGAFSVLPLVYSVVTSFKPLNELLIFPPRFIVQRPTLQNFLALPGLLSNMRVPLLRYIFNSFFVTVISTLVYVVVAALAAFVLSKSGLRSNKFIFLIIQYALLFNGTTLSVPLYLIYSNLGLIDTYWVMILPNIASAMGVFLMKQYMEDALPDALLEAARIDGAGPQRMFWQIVFPIVKPCTLTLTMFGFSQAWVATGSNTVFDETIKTLPTIMSQITAGGIARSGSAMAVTVILMIPPITVYLITQSNIVESMSSAGIKE